MSESHPPRLTWAEVWGKIAHDMGARSLCVRAQVGAVIVDSRNRIVDTGYNGPPEFFQHNDEPCTQWCPRAKSSLTPSGWKIDTSLTVPQRPNFTIENSSDGVFAVFDGGHRIEMTDENMVRFGFTPTYTELMFDYSDCPSLHAEANALMTCDRSVREGGTIYVTSHVCYGCAKLIANSGLRAVVVVLAADERDRAYRDPDKSYALMEQCGVEVIVEAI